jgi:hypothetical protein
MIRLKNSQFDLLFEDSFNRFQSGGLISGDVVKFRSGALNSPYLKNAEPSFKQLVRDLIESSLNLKVGAVRRSFPSQQYSGWSEGGQDSAGDKVGEEGRVRKAGGVGSAFGYSVDVVQEYAPGLWKNPITVPIELLERVEGTGQNRPPVPIPDEWKRKERITIKPEKVPKYKNRLETQSETD